MKTTLKIFSLILFTVLFSLTSCHKDDDDNNPQDDATNSEITLKIDNGSETVYTNVNAVVLADKLTMGGSNANSDIQIIVNSDISEGTYTSATEIGMTHGVDGQAIFGTATNVTSISFVVTTHNVANKHLKGTFSIEYNDNQDVNISHTATGTFDVKYM